MRVIRALLALWFAVQAVQAFEAGAAKVEITPPLGTPLNGYFDRLGRGAVAVHDPVWARCLYLSDGETSLFLVNADLCILNRELRDRVLELAPPDVPREHIILTATHTHSAQGAMNHALLFRSVSGRYMPEVLEATAQRFAEAMVAAYANRKRATIGYGVTTQDDLSENRRVPEGPIDPQIGVIRVDDSDGNAIAIITNFAAHPTTVGGEDMFSISADYPGYYYDELEKRASPGCVALFLNGAEGNQRPANPDNRRGWALTEYVGRTLAERAMEVASEINCGEATLHVGYATPVLPPSIASSLVPADTVLHTLEIDRLLVTFFPGEPCVEIGLQMRRQAKARGYANQFTVGLADDHLLYFVPRDLYGNLYYESGMNQYGPYIDQWFYRQFTALMTRGEPLPVPDEPPPAQRKEVGGATVLSIDGDPRQLGFQQGAAFREAIQQAFRQHVVAPCDSGAWIPDTGMWPWAPSFVNQTPLALPRLSIGARPLLAGLTPARFEQIEGMAEGAGLPFDAVWLTQCAPTFAAQSNKDDLYRSPFCTMAAVTGDRAGADDCLVGRNFDWDDAEAPVVFDVQPDKGRRFIAIGFPWNEGVFTGMNDAGVVVCVERVESEGEPSLDTPPVELLVREALQSAPDAPTAIAFLQTDPAPKGYHVLIAGPSGADARVLEFGDAVTVREPSDGLLLGVDPDSGQGDEATSIRYRRLITLTNAERIVSGDELAGFLRDREPGRTGRQQIWNDRTRHSVVFEPRARKLHVCFPTAEGEPGESQTFSLASGGSR